MELTNHAIERARERIGWSEKTLYRMSEKALLTGKLHRQFSGKILRYLNKLYLSHKNANNMRIYGENLFIFNNETLITIYQVPREFRKYL